MERYKDDAIADENYFDSCKRCKNCVTNYATRDKVSALTNKKVFDNESGEWDEKTCMGYRECKHD